MTIWSFEDIGILSKYDKRLEWNIRHLASQLPDIQPVRQGMSLAGIKKTYPNMWSFSLVQGVTMTTPPQTINLPAYYITYRQADIKRIVFGDLGFNHFFKPVKYGKLDYGKNYFTVKNPTQDTDREYTKGSYDADGLTDKSIVYLWKDGVPLSFFFKKTRKNRGNYIRNCRNSNWFISDDTWIKDAHLIITKSSTDAVVLLSLNRYCVLGVMSESYHYPPHLMEYFVKKFRWIHILYDNDETGRREANRRVKELNELYALRGMEGMARAMFFPDDGKGKDLTDRLQILGADAVDREIDALIAAMD